MSKNTTVKLDYPIKANGVEVNTITLRRLKVRDLKNAEKNASNNAEKEIFLVSTLAEISPDDTEEIDYGDWKKVQEVLDGFFS